MAWSVQKHPHRSWRGRFTTRQTGTTHTWNLLTHGVLDSNDAADCHVLIGRIVKEIGCAGRIILRNVVVSQHLYAKVSSQ